ncbi:superoxide dismutase [Millionella massiliensis]|uniref:superoxide dismutase n=1 Tax=Millionella massiliensis TaxID=1871023 RepID=UPI0023A83C95|nr:superoxide dismutase [Millionella massiliensis]
MKFELPALPYPVNALEPAMSARTIEFHWGKHEAAYINNLNSLIAGTPLENDTLEEIVRKAEGPVYNNAAQAWNHIFFFFQLAPNGQKSPSGALAKAIDDTYGSFDAFKEAFVKAGATLFGSGWVWLSARDDGSLEISQGPNALNPLKTGATPLLTADVWEHAYYLDYQNRRPDFLAGLWNLVDWRVIEKRYEDTL